MAIDSTIALNQSGINALAQGPADQMKQFGQMQNAIQQNRLLGIQAALGQAYKDNTDAQGNVDTDGVRAELAQTQAGSMALSSGNAGNTIEQAQGQASVQQTQLANSASRLGIFAHTLQGLITNPNTSPDDVKNAGQSLVDGGVFSPQQMQQELGNVPSDPGQLKTWLSTHRAQAGQALTEIGVQYGSPASVSTGGGTTFGTQAPAYQGGGFNPTGAPVANTLSPGEAATQVPGIGANGQPIAQPLASRLNQQGMGSLNPPQAGGNLPPGAERYPWNSTGAPQPAVAPNGAVPVGMAPGAAGAQATQQDAGSQALASLQGAVGSSPTRRTILNNMLGDLSNFTSGPFAGHVRGAEALLNNTVGANINPSGISSAQEFDAAAPKIAAAQGQALGALTNDKLHAELMAVPNSSKQNDTNRNLVYQMLGNEDALSAAQQAFQKTGQPPGNYLNWASSVSPFFDPRAYQLLRMPPAQQQQQLQQMQKAGILDDFKANVNQMAANGLIPQPQQGGGQPSPPAANPANGY